MDGDEEKKDPTHHADLDPKNMKVASRLYINFLFHKNCLPVNVSWTNYSSFLAIELFFFVNAL